MNDRVLHKTFSARFLMAVICTLFACLLTGYIVVKYPDGAGQASSQFFTVWAGIVAFYFGSRGVDKDVLPGGNQK